MGEPSQFTARDDDRDPALDGVRGFALVMVLCIHCFNPLATNAVTGFINHLFDSFWLAIDLFFVLSGFLITGILLRTREHPSYFRNFYARRALRIFPAYICILLFVFVIYPPFYDKLDDAQLERWLPWFLAYLQNIAMVLHNDVLPAPGVNHLWSLAIEEQFYLLWPLVVAAVPAQRMLRVCALVFALSVLSKFVLVAAHAGWIQVYVATPARFDGVAAGAFIAVYRHLHPQRGLPAWVRLAGWAAAAVLLAVFVAKSGLKIGSPLQIAVCTTAGSVFFAWSIWRLVTAPEHDPLRRLLATRMLVFLGTYSYGIYLIHWVIYWQIRTGMETALAGLPPNLVLMLVGVVVTSVAIALALLQWRFVEGPAMRLKRHFPYGRPRTVAAPPAAAEVNRVAPPAP